MILKIEIDENTWKILIDENVFKVDLTTGAIEKTNKEIASAKEEILKVHKSTDILKTGLLNVQRKNFMEFCYFLLEPDHVITKEEYEDIEEDHDVYNALDGNHKGDELFRVVSEKYFNQFNK